MAECQALVPRRRCVAGAAWPGPSSRGTVAWPDPSSRGTAPGRVLRTANALFQGLLRARRGVSIWEYARLSVALDEIDLLGANSRPVEPRRLPEIGRLLF